MTDYSALRKAGKLNCTIKAAKEKSEARQAARASLSHKPSASRMVDARITVPLGAGDIERAKQAGRDDYPRRQNWEAPQPSTTRKSDGYTVQDIDNGRYSSRWTYRHWTYRVWVTSYAWISKTHGREIGYRSWTDVTHIKAPRGYRWDHDGHGLKLVALADPRNDYHPDSDDLRAGVKHCVAKLKENAERRREAARAEREAKKQMAQDLAAMRRAEREGAAICLADSTRAGNCRVGTISFANRHGLDPDRHYRPTELLKIANGEAHRVRLAVAVGLRRHRHEMSRGFCDLADHRA